MRAENREWQLGLLISSPGAPVGGRYAFPLKRVKMFFHPLNSRIWALGLSDMPAALNPGGLWHIPRIP